MYLRVTRVLSWLVFILTGVSIVILVVAVDPDSLNRVGMALVFGLLFFFIGSSCLLLLLGMSRRFLGDERTHLYQGSALRQSFLCSAFLSMLLLTQYLRVLTWWGALLGLAFILLLELSYRRFTALKR